MSVAIIYDHFIAKGGAENVSLLLQKTIDDAHIECAYADNSLFSRELISGKIIESGFKTSKGPLNSFRLLFFYLLRYKLPRVDAAIVSGLFAPLSLLRKQPVRKKVIYFHMFPVFLGWSFQELNTRYGIFLALAIKPVLSLYTMLLKQAVANASLVYSNSRQAQSKFYCCGITTKVLYPPVSVDCYPSSQNLDFFVSTARLEETKRVRIIAEAFKSLPQYKIIFVGGGELLDEFKRVYSDCPNIQFVGWVEPGDVKSYYSDSIGLIYIPENEAFGIAPVEAFAAGRPVIGVAEAGLLETVTDSRLGVLLPTPISMCDLQSAICKFAEAQNNPQDISFRKSYAQKFDAKEFVFAIMKALDVQDEKSTRL